MKNTFRCCHLASPAVLLAILLFTTVKSYAGASASQWILVVNGQSETSRTIANHFCRWRGIPSRNIIVLNDVPVSNTISVETFREKILEPVLEEMELRKLSAHFQGIAYSSGFPTDIDLTGDLMLMKEKPYYFTPNASITGATFLFRYVAAKSPAVVGFESNMYACRAGEVILNVSLAKDDALQWKEFESQLEQKKFENAASKMQQVLRKYPHQFPLVYLAARAWAKTGRDDEALQLLELAVAAGWSYRQYLADDEAFQQLKDNSRFQFLRDLCPDDPIVHQPTRGFDARLYWGPNGVAGPRATDGVSYALSMMLAVTGEGGVSESEALEQLKRSIDADESNPNGRFYFSKTTDVRTTTREPGFPMARDRLEKLGYNSEIVTTDLPINQQNCLGVMIGSPSFSWKSSLSTLAPGAIAENLTSLGGVMVRDNSQTKLTEFLLAGAAASSGTVTEPYSIQAKFPHPMIQAHYAAGLTAAEAYYLSITGPYQLLIVGDPLCRPFSKPMNWQVSSFQNGQRLEGKVNVQFGTDQGKEDQFSAIDCLMDGVLIHRAAFAKQWDFRLGAEVPAGFHEMTWIATENSPLARKFEQRRAFVIGPSSDQVRISKTAGGTKAGVIVEAPSGFSIELRHDWEVIEKSGSNKARFSLSTDKVGRGPVRLQAIAKRGKSEIASSIVWVDMK